MAEADKDYSPETLPSQWLTYLAASERLGLSPSTVAARARRQGWPIRMSSMGETEVEVPGASLAARKVALDASSEMHERVASAVGRIDRLEATQARDKANAEERAAAKASTTKRPWWRLGR